MYAGFIIENGERKDATEKGSGDTKFFEKILGPIF